MDSSEVDGGEEIFQVNVHNPPFMQMQAGIRSDTLAFGEAMYTMPFRIYLQELFSQSGLNCLQPLVRCGNSASSAPLLWNLKLCVAVFVFYFVYDVCELPRLCFKQLSQRF